MFKNLLSLPTSTQKVKSTFFDFPLVFVFIFLSLSFAFLDSYKIYIFDQDIQDNLLYSLFLSILPLTSLKLFIYNKNISFIFELILSIFITLFMVYNVLNFDISIFFLIIINILSFVIAPFIFTKNTNKAFLIFIHDGLYTVSFAFLYALILVLGLNAIIASIAYLFELKVATYIYKDIAIISFIGLFPFLVLSNISRDFLYENNKLYLAKVFQTLVKNILLPLLYGYMVVLYMYFFKILWEGALPKGNLALMIIAFGNIGIFTKILVFIIEDKSSKLISLYDRYYYHIMIIPIGMLMLSFFRRVSDYGITESRYAIALFIIWFTFITIFSILKKENFNFKYIATSLFVLCFIALLGPISATNISAKSQLNRFYKVLEENNILVNGAIIPLKNSIDIDTRIKISSQIRYLGRNNVSKKEMIALFPTSLEQDYINTNKVLDILNVKYADFWMKKESFLDERIDINLEKSFINTKNYDYVIMTYIINNKKTNLAYSKNKKVETLLKNKILTLSFNKNEEVKFDIKEVVQRLKDKKIVKVRNINKNELELKANTKNFDIKLQIISMERYKNKINSVGAYILIKEKH